MYHRLFILFWIILVFSPGPTSAQAVAAPPTDDTQLWNELQISTPLNKKVDLVFTGTVRIGRGLSHPVSERGAVSLAYKATKFLTLETGYQYVANQPSKGRKNYTNNLTFAGTVKFPVGKLTVSDRNLVERRFRNSRPDNTRYRNRVRLEYPVALGQTRFNIFGSNEVFYDWGLSEWIRNRFSVGANKKLSQRLTAEAYYMRQNDGRSRPGDLHVIGSVLKIQL